MLSYISVKNFAIIENIEVHFKNGITALTGETGAGKSLLIDAIGLLLGDRATSNVVRTGEQKAIVEGIFKYTHPEITKLLNEYEIDSIDNELIIRRQITPTNNNIIKCNGETITLSQLRTVTNYLADIHTQHDTHRLINTETYLEIIDGFNYDETEVLLEQYNRDLSLYKKELKELKRLQNNNNDLLEKLDLMKFQKQELEEFNLDITEEQELTEKVEKMQNFDKIFEGLKETKNVIDSSNAIDRLYDASKELENIENYNEAYSKLKSRFLDAYYEMTDAYEELKNQADSLDFNPRQLDNYQDRLNDLDKIKRKYRKELPELIDYLETITKDIENIDHYDDVLIDQENIVKEAFEVVKKRAVSVTDLRKKTSNYIEQELIRLLGDLELKKALFSIEFKHPVLDNHLHATFLPNGVDEVDFLITTNPGEPLKSLSKSASGGEMSRIMLALKTLLAQSLKLSLIIFDEIDTGVSGYVANQVAKKMIDISQNTQVICITHIPQVAAQSEHHLFISKYVEEGRTKAKIEELDTKGRVKEIATMISGDQITESSIKNAIELLKQ